MSLKIKEQTAKKLYQESPDWFKIELENHFGKSFFIRDYKDIRTFDDCCRICGTTEEKFNFKFLNLGLDNDTINYEKAKIITKAINPPNWKQDWSPSNNQKKWFPVFNLSSGCGFADSGYGYDCSAAYSSVRLCFSDKERSDYAALKFTEIYKNFLT